MKERKKGERELCVLWVCAKFALVYACVCVYVMLCYGLERKEEGMKREEERKFMLCSFM